MLAHSLVPLNTHTHIHTHIENTQTRTYTIKQQHGRSAGFKGQLKSSIRLISVFSEMSVTDGVARSLRFKNTHFGGFLLGDNTGEMRSERREGSDVNTSNGAVFARLLR